MKRLSKTLYFALVVCLMLIVLAACSSKNNETPVNQSQTSSNTPAAKQEQPDVKEEPLVVNVLTLQTAEVPAENNPMRQWLIENKNIDLRMSGSSGEVTDQMNMMLAGGDIPDVVIFPTNELNNSIAKKWAEAGLTISTDELLSKYPNILKYSDPDYNAAMYANDDGKMYMIPGNPNNHPDVIEKVVGFFIKEDWLKQVNMDKPKTPDELFNVLMAFKEQIPDVDGKPIIPATFDHGGRQSFMYTWTKNWYDLSDDYKTLYWWFNHPNIEEYMVFMNKLYVNGLLDREFLTQQGDQYQAKLSSGRVGFTYQTHNPMDIANGVLKVSDPNNRYVPNPPIRVEGLPMPIHSTTSYNMFTGLVISKKFAENERNLERLAEFLNWNASEEGAFTLETGPEGEFFVKNADGLYEPKPEVKAELDLGDGSFQRKTGIRSYNLLSYPVIPAKTVSSRTEEFHIGQTEWAEGLQVDDNLFNPAGTGPEWDKHWGNLWPEIDKWQARAIFADSEAEARAITKEMIEHFKKIGEPEVTAEKLQLIEEYLNK